MVAHGGSSFLHFLKQLGEMTASFATIFGELGLEALTISELKAENAINLKSQKEKINL